MRLLGKHGWLTRNRGGATALLVVAGLAGCAGVKSGGGAAAGGAGTGGAGTGAGGTAGRAPTGSGGTGGGGPCVGLACAIDKCDGQTKTTLSGTIYDPAGKQPLYNVMVYVPNAPLDAIAEGVSCQRCDATASGRPVASALTDPAGHFVMQDVPVGTAIPLVIQIGKWRRQVAVPEVKACQDNAPVLPDLLRLPRNQAEGHLPKIAMTRGGADSLECLLRRIGVDDAEFTNPDGPGRVNIFYETGDNSTYTSGAQFPPVSALWDTIDGLTKYDMVIMSCHGESARARAQPTATKQTVKDYVDQGGRVFGSHFYFSFLRGVAGTTDAKFYQPSPFPLVAQWDGAGGDLTYDIDTGFPKGQAFADWLVNVSASSVNGKIPLTGVESPAMSVTPGLGQRWIYDAASLPYFSVATPIEKAATPDQQCGRFVHTGIHISGGGETTAPFPGACAQRLLTAQEKALEFLIFDLSACILPNDTRPEPPPVVP